MPHRVDFVHGRNDAGFFIREFFQNQLDGYVMIGHGLLNFNFFTLCLMREFGAFDSDAFAVSLCEHRFRLHVDELIFKGGTSRIDD